MKFLSKIHNYLLNLKHKCFFIANLKHDYYCIILHLKNHHYFTFYISEIKQIQFIKMQQDFKNADFTLTEFIYQTFKLLLNHFTSSLLLHNDIEENFAFLMFYMNNFFKNFKSFNN